jgi:uncharacterized protein (DUF362 family)/NAD-dependent dihydropyrimidine dehydrogenase PreA subunit
VERVLIESQDSYEREALKGCLARIFAEIGIDLRQARVLLKPNLVIGRPPDKAVNTHPELIAALAELLKDYGCDISVGDSPGYESTAKALKNSGIGVIIKYFGLKVCRFDYNIVRRNYGISPYKEFVLGEDPSRYDLIANLPKLKTHAMMGLTLGVKNTFGFISGLEKARWHLRSGRDVRLFAAMLIDLHRIVSPHITILDGILAMEGDGPTHGRPRHLGIVAASRSAFALDQAIEELLGITVPLPLTSVAVENHLVDGYEIVTPGVPAVKDFRFSKTMATDWGLPVYVKGVLRRAFLRTPKLKPDQCKGCFVCLEVCPAGVITRGEEGPRFDYSKCIRCFCCQEMCPEGAIRIG